MSPQRLGTLVESAERMVTSGHLAENGLTNDDVVPLATAPGPAPQARGFALLDHVTNRAHAHKP